MEESPLFSRLRFLFGLVLAIVALWAERKVLSLMAISLAKPVGTDPFPAILGRLLDGRCR